LKAAVLVELNKPLVLTEVNLTELRMGQVLVKVLISGICGSQLHEIRGFKGNAKFLPHLMGHEGCGIVEEVGPGVTRVKRGDKVVMHWRIGMGIESDFPNYSMKGKEFSSGKVNTLSEMSIVSENRLTRIPFETNPEFAALLGCSMSTALSTIEKLSELKYGESVAIIGSGGIGLNLIAAARIRGAGKIYAIDNSKSKRKLSILQGATEFFESIYDVQDNIDLIIDTTGITEIIAESLTKLGKDGRIILIGQPKPLDELKIPRGIVFFNGNGLKMMATQGGDSMPTEDIPRYINLYNSGILTIDNLITHRYGLEEINEGFDTLMSGNAGRILIRVGS
jgi:2-desacetyl-2-hydroxyethyl bacteriochlorophyllide A dehydrogenase